jgi:hypothetical protein
MRIIRCIIICLVTFSSCKSKGIEITQDYIYFQNGFDEGFALSLINVTQFDEKGIPEDFKDSLRVDLNYSQSHSVQKRIWFRKANEGYYWTKMFRGSYNTMPIELEEGRWYYIWSNKFATGFFKTDLHSYLLKKEKTKLLVYEKISSTNL